MREAVLAYCETVCPNVGDGHKETVKSGTIIHSKDQAWVWLDGLGSRIYINKNMSIAVANAMYAILGLSERDAVAAERAEMMKTVDALSAMVSVDPVAFAALETKNTALVAALKEMEEEIADYLYEDGERPDMECLLIGIESVLAANEKGGVQG